MRSDQEFADVTLICEDNQRIKAHKVILTFASSFFRSILYGNKHSHPIIYMRGIKIKYLEAAVDFIYHGETSIFQDDLDGFLKIAEELELKGMTADKSKTESFPQTKKINQIRTREIEDSVFQRNLQKTREEYEDTKYHNLQTVSLVEKQEFGNILPIGKNDTELDEIIESMLKHIDGTWTCTKCGKTGPTPAKVKRHIETHIEGISLPCKHCGKMFRSSNSLQFHVYRAHQMH